MGKLILNQMMKMAWYKVPCSSFDYAPAIIDPFLTDLGVKEAEQLKLPMSQVHRIECDARTMSLVASFLDMSRPLQARS